MKFALPSSPTLRRFVAALLLAHLLAVMAMAVAPGLHRWVHHDADDDGHDCAVTLFLHGGAGSVPTAPLALAAPRLMAELPALVSAPLSWVPSVYAASRILEHAPPCAG